MKITKDNISEQKLTASEIVLTGFKKLINSSFTVMFTGLIFFMLGFFLGLTTSDNLKELQINLFSTTNNNQRQISTTQSSEELQ
jgi:Na+(H+)/acetate symporter ActP